MQQSISFVEIFGGLFLDTDFEKTAPNSKRLIKKRIEIIPKLIDTFRLPASREN